MRSPIWHMKSTRMATRPWKMLKIRSSSASGTVASAAAGVGEGGGSQRATGRVVLRAGRGLQGGGAGGWLGGVLGGDRGRLGDGPARRGRRARLGVGGVLPPRVGGLSDERVVGPEPGQ